MPVGHLLMSIASVHSTTGNPHCNVFKFLDTKVSEKRFLKSFDLVVNSSMDPDVRITHVKGSDEFDVTTHPYNGTTPDYIDIQNANSLSIMWYLASFGALVMFFLLISFSEVCCKKSFSVPSEDEDEVSPPPYELFAPPTYDSLYENKKEKNQKRKKKRMCEVFVIPVFGDKSSSRVAPLEVASTEVVPLEMARGSPADRRPTAGPLPPP